MGRRGLGRRDCHDNALTSLDTTASTGLSILDCTDNPLTSVNTILEGESIVLTANGGGYIGLVYDWWDKEYYVVATNASGTFVNWTNAADDPVSPMAQTDILPATAYNLTANFLSLTSSDADGTIYIGGRITLTPNVPGGTWDFDGAYLSRDGYQFTALQAGTVRVTYTAGGVSTWYDVTIKESGLPSTGQDMTWVWLLAVGAALVTVAAVAKRKKFVVK